MDFAVWMESYIGGKWHTFDPRNNQRRIGRNLIARGQDAADVAYQPLGRTTCSQLGFGPTSTTATHRNKLRQRRN